MGLDTQYRAIKKGIIIFPVDENYLFLINIRESWNNKTRRMTAT